MTRSDRGRQAQALDLIDRAVDGVLLLQVACEFIAASRKLSAQGFTAADSDGDFSRHFGGPGRAMRKPSITGTRVDVATVVTA
jgi:hypothetical protein